MDTVNLPPELERFAAQKVASGRYRNFSEVLAAGVSLLKRHEEARVELLASALAAEEEADRVGCVTGDEMVRGIRARLAEKYGAASWGRRISLFRPCETLRKPLTTSPGVPPAP